MEKNKSSVNGEKNIHFCMYRCQYQLKNSQTEIRKPVSRFPPNFGSRLWPKKIELIECLVHAPCVFCAQFVSHFQRGQKCDNGMNRSFGKLVIFIFALTFEYSFKRFFLLRVKLCDILIFFFLNLTINTACICSIYGTENCFFMGDSLALSITICSRALSA